MTDIGQTLREARMRSKIDIADVEASTKIRAKYLRALENEEWSLLPGPTFVKSFLRTYAQYLGLDARMLVEEYKRRYERPHESEPFSAPLARDRDRRRGPNVPKPPLVSPTVLAGAGVIVVILVLLFVLGKWGSGGGGGNSPTSSAGASTTSTTARHKAKSHHHKKTTTPSKPKLASVRLVPTGSVYVCLIDSTGKKRIPGENLTPASPQRTYHAPRFLITVGNSQLKMVVNHKTLAVPPSTTATNYVITPTGRHTRPQGQGANCG